LGADANALDDGEQNSASDCAIARRFDTTAYGERTTSEETRDNYMPGANCQRTYWKANRKCLSQTAQDWQ